jgi:hypothetical protein
MKKCQEKNCNRQQEIREHSNEGLKAQGSNLKAQGTRFKGQGLSLKSRFLCFVILCLVSWNLILAFHK